MKLFLRNNGLSLVLSALFLVFWAGQAVCGWKARNEEAVRVASSPIAFSAYLLTPHFWQATGENWESEFLQMGCYVVLTCFLFQKGSAESKDPDEDQEDESVVKRNANFLYRNSLSLAFLALFLISAIIHAVGGLGEANRERAEDGLPPETMREFLTGSEFWFQSFQNWQSEYLAVLSIVVLSIFLRQHGSPESKKVEEPNSKTGGG